MNILEVLESLVASLAFTVPVATLVICAQWAAIARARNRFGEIPTGGGVDEIRDVVLTESIWLDQMLLSTGWFYDPNTLETIREIVTLHMEREYRHSPYSDADGEIDREHWGSVRDATAGYILRILNTGKSDEDKLVEINESLPFVGGSGSWKYGWESKPGAVFDLEVWTCIYGPHRSPEMDNVVPLKNRGRN